MLMLAYDEIIRKARIGSPEEIDEFVGEVQYLAFRPERGPVIFVEATVPNFVESLTQLDVVRQTAVIKTIAGMLPTHGDSMIIIRGKEGKNRGARVVRIRGVCEKENEIYLLITR